MSLLLALGLTACRSFEASVGREDVGATVSARPGDAQAPAARTSPSPVGSGEDGEQAAEPPRSDADGQTSDGQLGGDGQAADGQPATPRLKRIRFASGATSTTVEGTVTQGVHRRYVFAASKGQTLRIQVTSPSDAVNYGLTDPDGQPIKRVQAEARRGEFELPATGDYVISLAAAVDIAWYTVFVEIE
jgi:hypothetical protein